MRLLVILVCVAAATASPLKKSINAKAIEPVDQHLDSLRALEAGSGQNVDRAKKDVTFCVEVRQDNKPVVVDCADRQPVQPTPAVMPAPAPAPPAPEPQPEPQPDSQPTVQPGFVRPQPHTLNIEVPCEPEMAAYVVQPPEQVVYAPTGNCIPQVPSVVQVPTGPAAAPAQVLHIQTGPGLHGLHGHPGLHGLHGLHTLHGGHGLHHSVKPLHTQVVQPAILQPGQAHHLHTGVECTCHSTPGAGTLARAADAPLTDNQALAMKFLQDIQRNAGGSAQPMVISGPAPTTTMQGSAPGAPTQGSAPGATMRYLPMRPMIMPTSQTAFSQSSSMASGGVGGMGGMAGMGSMYPMGMGGQIMYPGMMRLKALEDSFTTGPMLPSIRAYRDDGEAAAAAAATADDAKTSAIEADAKPTTSESIDQIKKSDKDDKASRIARFVMEKDEAENRLEDN